jgi:hypothetical protein
LKDFEIEASKEFFLLDYDKFGKPQEPKDLNCVRVLINHIQNYEECFK